jgi:hypothetical protein
MGRNELLSKLSTPHQHRSGLFEAVVDAHYLGDFPLFWELYQVSPLKWPSKEKKVCG